MSVKFFYISDISTDAAHTFDENDIVCDTYSTRRLYMNTEHAHLYIIIIFLICKFVFL